MTNRLSGKRVEPEMGTNSRKRKGKDRLAIEPEAVVSTSVRCLIPIKHNG